MSSLSSFIKEPKNINYEGEDSDEKILYVLRQSHLTNLGWTFMLLLLALVPVFGGNYLLTLFDPVVNKLKPLFILMIFASWYLMIFGLALFNYLNWYFNVYIISNKKIIDFDFHGLTYKNISDTPISNVEDVTAKINGPLNMIFDIGDVYIQTAAEHREFDFMNVDNPGKIRDIISDMAVQTGNTKKNV